MNDQIQSDQPAVPATDQANVGAKSVRLMSLDALRGFDMFWIVGGDVLVKALEKVNDHWLIKALSEQMDHVGWRGFHFEDLIFPMFVFIVGASLVFSLGRTIEQHGRGQAVLRIFRRALLMYLLGVFYYGSLSTPFKELRLWGVLQRIAICYLFAGLRFCYFGKRGCLIWCVGLLAGSGAVMTFVPAPGETAGDTAEGHNLANWIDKEYLPFHKWDGDHDPEGLLSTFPAIANCLIGVLAGMILRSASLSNWKKVLYLALAGLALLAVGWAWDLQFPVIKKIWTSSFVLVACGYSLLFLAFFHLVIETWGLRMWAQPFVWIGMNPITIYMIENLVDLGSISKRIVGGQLNRYFTPSGQQLIEAVVAMLVVFAIARFLYVKKIFLRL